MSPEDIRDVKTPLEYPDVTIWIILGVLFLLLLVSIVGLILSVLLLNFEGSLLTLDINLIGSKLSPKFVEFFTIFVNVIVTVEHNDVFLVTLTSLKSPVK